MSQNIWVFRLEISLLRIDPCVSSSESYWDISIEGLLSSLIYVGNTKTNKKQKSNFSTFCVLRDFLLLHLGSIVKLIMIFFPWCFSSPQHPNTKSFRANAAAVAAHWYFFKRPCKWEKAQIFFKREEQKQYFKPIYICIYASSGFSQEMVHNRRGGSRGYCPHYAPPLFLLTTVPDYQNEVLEVPLWLLRESTCI